MAIINPSLSEEDRNSSIDNLKSILEKAWTKVEKEDIWGEKKLAYKINRSTTGFYILLDLDLDWTKIKDISKEINLDRNIWRYMFVKKED
jgi:small subunit ribosomal protein S6